MLPYAATLHQSRLRLKKKISIYQWFSSIGRQLLPSTLDFAGRSH
jgi:hypothetical protein